MQRWRVLLARLRPLVLLGACALGGCEKPLAPSDVAGTYVLVRVNGAAQPADIPIEGGPTIRILYDTIVLRADRSTHVARAYNIPPSSGFVGVVGDGTYAMDGLSIELLPPPPRDCGGVVCSPPADVRRLWLLRERPQELDRVLGVLEYSRVGPPAP